MLLNTTQEQIEKSTRTLFYTHNRNQQFHQHVKYTNAKLKIPHKYAELNQI
jgi:hypothetical protein